MRRGFSTAERLLPIGPAVVLALAGAASTAAQTLPPRYRLEVGDRLIYERRVRVLPLEADTPRREATEQIQLWCLSADGDERMILADLLRAVGGRLEPTRAALLHLTPRGLRRLVPETLPDIAELDCVFELLPILPPALAFGSEWLTEADHFGRRWRCTRAGSGTSEVEAVRIDFELVDPTGVSAALGQTQRGSCWFDARAGLVVRVESEWRDARRRQRVQSVARLHERRRCSPGWCQRQVHDVERFLYTLRLEQRALDRILFEPQRVEQLLRDADRYWAEFARDLALSATSPLRRIARDRRMLLRRQWELWRERAALVGSWLGRPAADWSLQAPDGRTIASEQIRDRFVLEFFWSGDSPASLRSFTLLRELQEQMPAAGFRVVCLNIDANVADGRRAAELCGHGLLHVLAGRPVGGEAPSDLPVCRLLDRAGVVRGVLFGWRPDLVSRVRELAR